MEKGIYIMSLSKRDLLDLLEKASVLVDTVIQELPDDEEDNDNFDLSPIDYLLNAAGDIQDAINSLSGD
jgi:hypothetical protein